jgi:hypothetical protein
MENTDNKWEFEQNYGKILSMIMVTAVKEIESQLGRKVVSLTIPKPAVWNDPDKQPTMNVRIRLQSRLGRLVGRLIPFSESDFLSIGIDDGISFGMTEFWNLSIGEFWHSKIGCDKTGKRHSQTSD